MPSATRPRCPAASAGTGSTSARTTPARSASARSRSPTTSRRSRASEIEAGPRNIWRYKALLPVPADIEDSPNTEPGFTRLLKAHNLGRELGIDNLWVKDDSTNPTNSFKDRVVACALSAAREFGSTVFACPSTGNLANAVAAAGARAGIRTVVFIPADLEKPKQVNSAVYTDSLVAVNGNYDDVNRLASEIAGEEDGWAFVNVNVRPYYAEGSKTLGFEIAEQLGWRLPDQVVIPVASGSQLTKVDKAFRELIELGLVEDKPYRVYGAQATGCSPVAAAFKADQQVVRPVRPDTIAKSLAIGNPADGVYVLDICRRTGGAVEDVSDDEVREGILLLARTEGIFTETAGGTTVGVLKKLVETGQLDPTPRDGRDQHRNGPQDPRRGRRPGRGSGDHRPVVRCLRGNRPGLRSEMSVSVRIPTILRTYTGGESEVSAEGDTLGGRPRRPRRQLLGHQGPGPRRGRRAAPVRQRLRRQRRRALPRQPRHADARRHADLGHPGGGRRLRQPGARVRAAPRGGPPGAVSRPHRPGRTSRVRCRRRRSRSRRRSRPGPARRRGATRGLVATTPAR